MKMQMRSENQVLLSGYIPEGFAQTHEELGKKMYTGEMNIFRRKSAVYDLIPVVIPEEMWRDKRDINVSICGEIRSRIVMEEGKKETQKCVRALRIYYLDRQEPEDINEVYLTGNLKSAPIAKKIDENTGGWKLARIVLAIKRSRGVNGRRKEDCISCLVWNENAETVRNLEPGQKLKVQGRIQSRPRWCEEKNKYIEELDVSVKKLEVL